MCFDSRGRLVASVAAIGRTFLSGISIAEYLARLFVVVVVVVDDDDRPLSTS